MLKTIVRIGVAAAALALTASLAQAQEFNFKLHQFLPAQSAIPANFLKPWAEKVEKESGGRIKIELFPSMQLGGKPPSLIDQVTDGVVDFVWTLPGYTPGRFPKAEVFELPFIASNAEASSQAFQAYAEKHMGDDFPGLKVIAVHTHGPGLIHSKTPVSKLEDLKGMKLRGPTRTVTNMLSKLGAEPIGMPVPQVPESLSRGVIDGAVIPWEVTVPLKITDLVKNHTRAAGNNGLYVATFVFAMNKASYDKLPDDLKKVIDDNSGMEAAKWAGQVMDQADVAGEKIAVEKKNNIITLSDDETARWKEAAQPVYAEWIAEMDKAGQDGKALVDEAKALIDQYTK
ncbi:MAG: TRAP transporter substrate-binding protein [Rhodobiaceae bacterium]|nr:TRAP transporter substrate-binding protein [Rhodobiaceae bacterium]